MRLKSLMALAVTIASLGMVAAPQPASATFWDRPDQPAGWGHVRTVRHWVYYPRYRHVYVKHTTTDPYAYRYAPRGYYPYYNSGYWGGPRIKRFRGHLPPYYEAWGTPRRGYNHVQWHRRHHDGHPRGDW
jgi:hypothetical protein